MGLSEEAHAFMISLPFLRAQGAWTAGVQYSQVPRVGKFGAPASALWIVFKSFLFLDNLF